MQLVFALALLFVVAHAEPGYQITTYWDNCTCNGMALKTVAVSVADVSNPAQCSATAADTCDSCSTPAPTDAPTTAAPTDAPTTAAPTDAPTTAAPVVAPKKRGVDLSTNIGMATTCSNVTASRNSGANPDTWAGWLTWDTSACDGSVVGWTEFRIGTCFDDESIPGYTFTVACDGPTGTSSLTNYTSDPFCNNTNGNVEWQYNSTCMGANRTSTCNTFTAAPTAGTAAPTAAPGTAAPTAAPTASSSTTIYDIKQLCRIDALRTVFETAITVGVNTATTVPGECTIGSCSENSDYTGAQFKYECKADSGSSYNTTTGALICPSIATTSSSVFGLAAGVATCQDLNGNPTGVKGTILMVPLEASGSLLSTSFFMLVAMLLANLF